MVNTRAATAFSVYTSNNYDSCARALAHFSLSRSLARSLSRLLSPLPCTSLRMRVRVSSRACARVCARTYICECSRGQIHARAYKQTRGLVPAVPGRVRRRAVHVDVYDEVPGAIKFTGSVLHRVARVAFPLFLSVSPFLCLFSLYTLDMAGWKQKGGSMNSVSGGQWLLW